MNNAASHAPGSGATSKICRHSTSMITPAATSAERIRSKRASTTTGKSDSACYG